MTAPVIKNRDLVNAIESINAIAALKLPVRTSFAVALNLKAVRDHMEVFNEQRTKILDKHTLKDKKGVPLPAYAPENGPNGKPLLEADGRPTIVKDDKGEIVNKVLKDQVQIDEPAAYKKDIEELLDINVTKLVQIKPIKLGDLEGTLEPQHFVNILWMFKEE